MSLLHADPEGIDTQPSYVPATSPRFQSTGGVDDAPALDRDRSLVAFQRRVLEEAQDDSHPLLERVKFLAILGTNIDELRMVRAGRWRANPDHSRRLHTSLLRILREGHAVLDEQLVPELARHGIHLCHYADLSPDERADVDDRFVVAVLPLITPQIVDPSQPPQVPNLGLNFAAEVVRQQGAIDLALVRVPDTLSPLLAFARSGRAAAHAFRDEAPGAMPQAFVWLEEVVAANLHRLFPDATVASVHLFRIVRDAHVSAPNPDEPDLADRVADAVRRRDSNPVVVLIAHESMPPSMADMLTRVCAIRSADAFRARVVFDLRRLWDVSHLNRADLHETPLIPRMPAQLRDRNIFDAIVDGDILLHHPYESFQPVVNLFQQAALDPDVEEISVTLYRMDRDVSPVGNALLEAIRRGKRVRVVVELKARFDEHRNAQWARSLARAGANVIYGPRGLKVHGKLALVVRREGETTRRYVHVSTGNYSGFNARVYTDLGLLTCDPEVGSDASDIFAMLAGDLAAPAFRKLVVAPFGLRDRLRALIEREIEWARRGQPAHIVLKMNALVDREMAVLLQRASQAGVRVDLLVRGICCLRPGVPGVSDGIRVRSIVGRFLEHSRIWYFHNGGRDDVYIGSADVMPRNLDRRVEVVTPIADPSLARRVRNEILALYLADTVKARELRRDGRYVRVTPLPGQPATSCQEAFVSINPEGVLR